VTVSLASAARSVDPSDAAGFEVGFVTGDGEERRVPLHVAWSTPLELGRPVRRFTARKGQRHLSGLWWCATTGGHVGFESWLERDRVMLLDFDPAVTGIASQPFWLHWTDEAGTAVAHAPDFFARRADGSALVLDCRPVERRRSRDVAKFDATARACGLLGWDYELVGAADRVVTANVRWLSGYRHSRHHLPETAERLRSVFVTPAPLLAGAEQVNDPLAVLPVLFHLLWRQELSVDVSVPLHPGSVVAARGTE
jgi:hypothetical protein